jgi:hypothetical protein
MEVVMSKSFRLVSLAAAMVAIPTLLAAQNRPIELGVDAGITYRSNSPHVTTIGIPIQDLRIGIGVSDKISIEPRASFNYLKVQNTKASSQIEVGAGLLYHLNTLKSGIYIRPFASYNHIDAGGATASQFTAGGGIGYKAGTGGVVGRFEAGYAHAFETNTLAKSDNIIVLLGLSVFTK